MHEFSAEQLGVQRCGIYSQLPALLESYGIEAETFLEARGFSLADFADLDRPLPFADVVRLVDACATVTGDNAFGLILGLKARIAHLGLIGNMVRTAPTLGRALRNFIENHHRYVRGGAPYVVEQDPYVVRHRDEVLIGYRCMIAGLPTLQFLLASVGVGIALVRELCGQSPKEILLACSSDRVPAAEIRTLVRPGHVRFDSHHFGITYPKSVIEAPLPGGDPVLYREAMRRVHGYWNGLEPDFVDQIRRLLLPVLMADRAHMRTLCETTGLHPRTINRRLAEHGTSLRAIVNELRFDIACQLLRHTYLPVAAVAQVMGYSEAGVFVRAFRQWSGGSTPEAWRTRKPPVTQATPAVHIA